MITSDTLRWVPKSFPPERENPHGPPPVKVMSLVGIIVALVLTE